MNASTRFCSCRHVGLGWLLAGWISAGAAATADLHPAAAKPARPNILWITSEDNAAFWLGCYGNADAHTPRLDALAAQGLRFDRAYANGPVCAVARSAILNGAHAVTQGTQHMRSRHPIPASFRPYVTFLREQGYYCVNNAKTDYNFRGDDRAIWDECSHRAHYRNRAAGQPFFAIFNLTISHESQLFPENVRQNRARGLIPETPRVNPQHLTPPPHVPDLPEMRADFAVYHDLMTALDTQVGQLLDELQAEGLAEDTIVFYYADNGGPTPRGKRYLEDTGTRVPLLVRVPPRWQSLAPFPPGTVVTELVSFVDLAPTLLSLVGLEKPASMQGRAFLGPHRQPPADDAVVFLYADRFDEIYGMRRGLSDGRFKYIRRFTPHLPAAPYSQYALGMASWQAWQRAAQAGQLPERYSRLWHGPQEVEQLFDLVHDPWEVRNLAGDPAHSSRLTAWRERLRQVMTETRDTGLVPEPLFAQLPGGQTVHEFVRRTEFDYPGTLNLAFQASAREPQHLPALRAALQSANPVQRYWSALGCVILGNEARAAVPRLKRLLNDAHAVNRITAARALYALGARNQAGPVLIAALQDQANPYAALAAANALAELNALELVPKTWVERTLNDPGANEYLQRFARRMADRQP